MINRMPHERILATCQAVFDEAARDSRQMAFAIADEAGALVFGARTDRCDARVLRHATRKAYTSAVMRRDVVTFRRQNAERGNTLADWGDAMLTQLPGGVVIAVGGECYGGLAVGGNTTERDEEIARIALGVLVTGFPGTQEQAGAPAEGLVGPGS